MLEPKPIKFIDANVYIYKINKRDDIEASIKDILNKYKNKLPQINQRIFIKPNFNNDLMGLTGNSIDLRILYFLIKELKSLGYNNIIVGDGPNVGIFRRHINWIKRLRLDKLSKILGVKIIDINADKNLEFNFGGKKINLSKTLLESDFLINLSKVKTHVVTTLSCSLKNSIGTAIGDSKRLIHANLFENIVRLNEIIKWDIIISDGIVAMEGNGPGDGTPLYSKMLISGDNPFIVDLAISKIFNFPFNRINYLSIALKKGLINQKDYDKKIIPIVQIKSADRPKMVEELSNTKALFFIKAMIRPFLSNYKITNFFYKLGATQDQYCLIDDEIEKIVLDKNLCKKCRTCELFCPLGFSIDNIDEETCLKCAYCYFVCPNSAKVIVGKEGFLEHHIKKYRKLLIKELKK